MLLVACMFLLLLLLFLLLFFFLALNAVSQPSVSPLPDLINECWATRPDSLCAGHIWTLYIEIQIWLSTSSCPPPPPPRPPLLILEFCPVLKSHFHLLFLFSRLPSPLSSSCLAFSSLLFFFFNLSSTFCINHSSLCFQPPPSSPLWRLAFDPRSSSPRLGVVPRSSPCLHLLSLDLCALNV